MRFSFLFRSCRANTTVIQEKSGTVTPNYEGFRKLIFPQTAEAFSQKDTSLSTLKPQAAIQLKFFSQRTHCLMGYFPHQLQ
jgi:hypothetical protein